MSDNIIKELGKQFISIRQEQDKLILSDPDQVNPGTKVLNEYHNGQLDGIKLAIRLLSKTQSAEAQSAAESYEYRFELAGREITGTLSSDQPEGLSFVNDLILGSEDLTSVLEVRDAGKTVWSVLE